MKRSSPLVMLCILFFSLSLHAQGGMVLGGGFGANGGTQDVTFGSDYDTAYKTHPSADSSFFGLDGYVSILPESPGRVLYSFDINAGMQIPIPTDSGLSTIYGSGLFNLGVRHFSVGSGIDIHQFLFPSKNVTYNRPNELLVGIPITGKFDLGRFYAKGGVSLPLSNTSSNVVDTSLGTSVVVSTANLTLSKSRSSQLYEAEGGVLFGSDRSWGLRASYQIRDVYFDVTSNPTPWKSYYDFHSKGFNGGIFFSFGAGKLTGDMVNSALNTVNDKLAEKNAEMQAKNEEAQARMSAQIAANDARRREEAEAAAHSSAAKQPKPSAAEKSKPVTAAKPSPVPQPVPVSKPAPAPTQTVTKPTGAVCPANGWIMVQQGDVAVGQQCTPGKPVQTATNSGSGSSTGSPGVSVNTGHRPTGGGTGCVDVTRQVSAEMKLGSDGITAGWLTNHTNQTITCTTAFRHTNGTYTDYGTGYSKPGQRTGGEMGGLWTTGKDIAGLEYVCFAGKDPVSDSGKACSDVRW